mmetsp:Transcript_4773/g.11040  ORF Transcript_4773/g.11040 Transcript_4773/m.11040 type:complete len:167 (-) Transcript_4773:661-1161(-)
MHTHSHAQRSSLPGAMSTRSVSLSLWCNSKTAALLNTPRQPLSPLPLSPTNRTRQTDRQASQGISREGGTETLQRQMDGQTDRRRGAMLCGVYCRGVCSTGAYVIVCVLAGWLKVAKRQPGSIIRCLSVAVGSQAGRQANKHSHGRQTDRTTDKTTRAPPKGGQKK